MAKFVHAFNDVIKAEGGYVNDPDDAGGETYLGISRKNHPNSKMWKCIDQVKKENPKATNKQLTNILKLNKEIDKIVQDIYKTDYWDKLRCDEINNQDVAEQMFDMGVNAGTTRAIKLMRDITKCSGSNSVVTDDLIKAINHYGKIRFK